MWNMGLLGASFFRSSSMVATGGMITDNDGYRYHTFRSSGTFQVNANPNTVEYLVVAGGGAGGGDNGSGTGGGGGAGGMLFGTSSLTIGSYPVTVGNGGICEGFGLRGNNGSDSVFNSITAIGGGGGGGQALGQRTGGNGGSGGGAGGSSAEESNPGGTGISGQGNDGGTGAGGGSGGGAGAPGTNSNSNDASDGGDGLEWPIGSGNYYAGGGGASPGTVTFPNGLGGLGGGGIGGNPADLESTAGTPNTGGGGGGSAGGAQIGSPGGSGIVVIRYPYVKTSSFDLLETTVLASSASSVTFSGLDAYSDYKHLQIRAVARGDHSASLIVGKVIINSDTATNYAFHRLQADGTSVVSNGYASQSYINTGLFPAATESASNAFGVDVLDILDFASASKNTTLRSLNGSVGNTNLIALKSNLWNSTSAITSILYEASSGNWVSGSRFSLYGVK